MAKFELKLPKMGESVAEATVTSWLKNVGDTIELDEVVLEIATDKVDSEVPSEVEGILIEKLFDVDEIVQVGQTIAIIQTENGEIETQQESEIQPETETQQEPSTHQLDQATEFVPEYINQSVAVAQETVAPLVSTDARFYSPLVKNIAKEEGVSQEELDTISGTGVDNRVTKNDILDFIKNKTSKTAAVASKNETTEIHAPMPKTTVHEHTPKPITPPKPTPVLSNGDDEIIEMTRMGKIISHHMVESVKTSAHVQSFIEADVTNIWNWRNKVKDAFLKREGENLTFTPIFMEVIAKALRDYPMMNISLQGDTVVKKKHINLGMAASLPDGNLIVPVIKNADQLNLVGLTKQVNDLANRARKNQLKPDDIQGGTYTVTNIGSFGSIMGTPIINQPQVGILALGVIRKVPAVIETKDGDFIGIRYRMFLSHSYDHRVVNGALGGQFVKAVKDYLETWDSNREI